MGFSPGEFDFLVQVETEALGHLVDALLVKLKNDNDKHKFGHDIGGSGTAVQGRVDVTLTDLSIPSIHSKDPNDRFKVGNTLTSFQVNADLLMNVQVLGIGPTFAETLELAIKDLAIGTDSDTNGFARVALGFEDFDIDAGGLTTLRGLNPTLEAVADFIGLGIRTVLRPLSLRPFPVLQVAGALAKQGLFFEGSSPFLGTTVSGDGLFLAMDFQSAQGNPSDIGAVEDISDPTRFNIATVLSDRPVNQFLPPMLATAQARNSVSTSGANFKVTSTSVRFMDPDKQGFPAKVDLRADAAARVKVKKGGFFGSLFGGSKKVTITALAEATVDVGMSFPQPGHAQVEFEFDTKLTARGSVQSVTAAALVVLLQPFFTVFLTVFSQVFNIAADLVLPLKFKENVLTDANGQEAFVTLELEDLNVHLAAGGTLGLGGLSEATLKMRVDADGKGSFQLSHFLAAQFGNTDLPLVADFEADSISSRDLGTGVGELFLGTKIRTI